MTAPRPIWIDTDGGFDDIVAVLVAAAQPHLAICGISLVAGNGPLAAVIDNMLRAADLFGWTAPMHAGADRPLVAPLVTAESVLGQGGLSTTGRALPDSKRRLDGTNAVESLREQLESTHEALTLVPLGPLTNIAQLLSRHPQVTPKIREIALMGGSAGRGNHTAAAEFNIACDPEAAEIVFGAGVPIRMFGLDVGRICTISGADSAALRSLGSERAAIMADHLDAYLGIASPDRSKPMSFYDPTVTAWLADEGCIGFEPARVDIECSGRHTRGMSVCEFRVPRKAQPNAAVAMTADAPRFREILHAAFARVLR